MSRKTLGEMREQAKRSRDWSEIAYYIGFYQGLPETHIRSDLRESIKDMPPFAAEILDSIEDDKLDPAILKLDILDAIHQIALGEGLLIE